MLPHSGHWVIRPNGGALIRFHSSLPEAAVYPHRRHTDIDWLSVVIAMIDHSVPIRITVFPIVMSGRYPDSSTGTYAVGDPTAGMKRTISTDAAPAAVGAYSQATTDGSTLYTAGQIPLTPDGELLAEASVADQTAQALDNVVAILESEGLDTSDVLKTTVYLSDIGDFEEMNETYSTYFDAEPPARSAVEAGALPKGVDVEIEAVATLP